jgi:LacI family transcriptional regulator
MRLNIYEIAKRAGVSIATVSRVVNGRPGVREATREKVQAILDEAGYSPNAIARSLATNSTRTIGILATDIRDSYYAAAIYRIERHVSSLGYQVMLCSTGNQLEDKKRYLRLLLDKKVDGILLIGSPMRDHGFSGEVRQAARQVPVVLMNFSVSGENIYCVLCDDAAATRRMVKLCAGAGKRRIAYLYDMLTPSGKAKIEGYHKGMSEVGLEAETYLLQVPSGLEGARVGMEILLSLPQPPQVIMTSEDTLAVGVLKCMGQRGLKAPNDLWVAAYNNTTLTLCTTPELTTVENYVEPIATMCAEKMIQALKGERPDKFTWVMPRILLRGSTVLDQASLDAMEAREVEPRAD